MRHHDVASHIMTTVELVVHVILQMSQWKKMNCRLSEDLSVTLGVGHARQVVCNLSQHTTDLARSLHGPSELRLHVVEER